jgi:hypothetical protein
VETFCRLDCGVYINMRANIPYNVHLLFTTNKVAPLKVYVTQNSDHKLYSICEPHLNNINPLREPIYAIWPCSLNFHLNAKQEISYKHLTHSTINIILTLFRLIHNYYTKWRRVLCINQYSKKWIISKKGFCTLRDY